MITLAFDIPRFNQQMQELGVLCGLSNAQVVSRTTRLWFRDCLKATPPTGRGPAATNLAAQFKLGTKRIKTDVTRRAFPLLKSLTKKAEKGSMMESVQRLTNKGQYDVATQLLHSMGIATDGVIAEPSRPRHNYLRDKKTGRVPKGVAPFFVANESAQKSYHKSVQARLGRGKAGWAQAAAKLRMPLPKWVMRHSMPGHFKGITDVQKPSIEFGNRVYHVQKFERKIMKNTAKFREKVMLKELIHYWRAAQRNDLTKLRARFAKGRIDVFVAMD